MEPIEFKEQTVVFAKDQPEYIPLPAHLEKGPEGYATSCWKLNDEEVELIGRTKKVWLRMMTFNKPLTPVYLTVRKNEIFNAIDDIEPVTPFKIFHNVTIKLGWKDIIRCIFGKPIKYNGFVNVDRAVDIVDSGGATYVEDIFPKKQKGFVDIPSQSNFACYGEQHGVVGKPKCTEQCEKCKEILEEQVKNSL